MKIGAPIKFILIFAALHGLFQCEQLKAQINSRDLIDGYARMKSVLQQYVNQEPIKYQADQFITDWSHRINSSPLARIADVSLTDGRLELPGVRLHGSEIVLQLKPSIPPQELQSHISRLKEIYHLKIIDSIPPIGLLIVTPKDPELVVGGITLNLPVISLLPSQLQNQTKKTVTLQEVIKKLEAEDDVLVAAPNLLIGLTMLPPKSSCKGSARNGDEYLWDWRQGPQSATATQRDGNWGLKYMRFPAAWNLLPAIERRNQANPPNQDTNAVGVLDWGFGHHKNLGLEISGITQPISASIASGGHGNPQLPAASEITIDPEDHGLHVAGIIGALWTLPSGINGCVQKTHEIAGIIPSIPYSADVKTDGGLFAMTDVISTLTKFIIEYPNIRAINISLAFNWAAREGLNPNVDREIQHNVAKFGIITRAVADIANDQGIILVTAAGNDSRPGLAVEAQWASPFNWAAMNKGPFQSPARNIVVVESIGRDGKISSFSNVHGSVSAPGEGILSCVACKNPFHAYNEPRQSSENTYAVLDGTSMAAPHVTGLISLMYAYNPDLNHLKVLEILGLTGGNIPSTKTPAPTIDAFDALLACRPDSLRDLADLNHDGKVDRADFEIFKRALAQVEGHGGAEDLNGDGVSNDNENVFPYADLNGSGKLSRDPADKRRVLGEMMSDLDIMKKAWTDGPAPDLEKELAP